MPVTGSLQAGACTSAQSGTKDDGEKEADDQGGDDHEPLIVGEEHVELEPEGERTDAVDVVADAVGGEVRSVEDAYGLGDVGGLRGLEEGGEEVRNDALVAESDDDDRLL